MNTRWAKTYQHNHFAGILEMLSNTHYRFTYDVHYQGPPISLTMPITQHIYEFEVFPPFFDGLLPEGVLLEALLRRYKLDRNDYFGQLITVGRDLVGSVTVEAML
jgi:serine/threonine-protein kinase HipA